MRSLTPAVLAPGIAPRPITAPPSMASDEDIKKEMNNVDLSLADNYLPAVACMIKTLWISCLLVMVGSEH